MTPRQIAEKYASIIATAYRIPETSKLYPISEIVADNIEKAIREASDKYSAVTRFEVIDDSGRSYSEWDVDIYPEFQDGGRTLKIFLSKRKNQGG